MSNESTNPQANPEHSGSQSQGEGQPLDTGLLPKIIRFDDLSRCGDEVWIEHSGQLYRLRKTKQNKLILTK